MVKITSNEKLEPNCDSIACFFDHGNLFIFLVKKVLSISDSAWSLLICAGFLFFHEGGVGVVSSCGAWLLAAVASLV